MKVVHFNTLDAGGGAARAAVRLHDALRQSGVDSVLTVMRRTIDDIPNTRTVGGAAWALSDVFRKKLDRIPLKAARAYPSRVFSPSIVPDGSHKVMREEAPDIVNLHWVQLGFIRIESLARWQRPVVWTLHDSWPFTGGCHLPYDCTRYEEGCGHCPALDSSIGRDLSRRVVSRKQRAWRKVDIQPVAPSRWLAARAQASRLFADRHMHVIPNGVDLSVFRPFDKASCRTILNLPQNRTLLAYYGGDHNKGGDLLADALRRTASFRSNPVEVVAVGASEFPADWYPGVPVHRMRKMSDERSVALVNNAVDVVVVPSRSENLPFVAIEAEACGVPVVAFDVGGIPEVVDHRVTGYLARPLNTNDLGEGIAWVVSSPYRHAALCAAAVRKAKASFNVIDQAAHYNALYQSLTTHGRK
jgi:glycosyltransferase involved in cell wall biosynthesis